MKSRTITVIVFLLVFASATSAMPMEGMENQDSEFFDELSGYATGAWNYVAPSLEPLTEHLYATAAGNNTFLSHRDGTSSTIPILPVDPNRGMFLDDEHILFQAPSEPNPWYPSPSVIHQQPYLYPPTPEIPTENVSFPELTTNAMEQFNEQPMALSEGVMQNWVDGSYIPGQRVQTVPISLESWPGLPQNPQNLLFHTMQPPAQVLQPQSLNSVPRTQPIRPQGDSRSAPGHLRCGHDGCQHTSHTSESLRHHRRYHIPMRSRPHPCPHCHQRFLCPREVQRHLPTHGLGQRYYCSVASCLYATKGFGRKDHLTRHVRSKHAADSVLQDTKSRSSVRDTSSI